MATEQELSDYFAALGVESSAAADDIRKAYKKKSLQHHPDRGGDAALWAQLQKARSVPGH